MFSYPLGLWTTVYHSSCDRSETHLLEWYCAVPLVNSPEWFTALVVKEFRGCTSGTLLNPNSIDEVRKS